MNLAITDSFPCSLNDTQLKPAKFRRVFSIGRNLTGRFMINTGEFSSLGSATIIS